MTFLDRLGAESTAVCQCAVSIETPIDDRRTELTVDAAGCPNDGDLQTSSNCRATVVETLADRDADVVRIRTAGRERVYDGGDAALLLAAGRFVERAAFHDEALAERARRDPLRAAHEATGRAGPIATIAAETGLAESAAQVDGYQALRPFVGVSIARERVTRRPPSHAVLNETWDLETGATVRLYEADGRRHYHLTPLSQTLDDDAAATLAVAHERLATGAVEGGDRAPGRAVRHVADQDTSVETLSRVLRRHTHGYGVLEDLFADERVSDVFATAPVARNPVRITLDGDRLPTNVRLTPRGTAALASRFRRLSGRAFSRASPTLDTVVTAENGAEIRVAGVGTPASDGFGFAFRSHGGRAWTLPALIANQTISPAAAALLSLTVERAGSILIAGPRGAGKTTLLGALLWELPETVRTVVIEDTPELPLSTLGRTGRDVQPLRTTIDDGPGLTPTTALRTALRLGDGALVVGEVRGKEAKVLYEAMRVGANDSAVLGTIHGDGGDAVRERVVTDLDVPESSFAATDLVITLAADEARHVAVIEEVRTTADGVHFESLYEFGPDGLESTGVLSRGNSRLLAALGGPTDSYAKVRRMLRERRAFLEDLAETERTTPDEIAAAYRTCGDRAA